MLHLIVFKYSIIGSNAQNQIKEMESTVVKYVFQHKFLIKGFSTFNISAVSVASYTLTVIQHQLVNKSKMLVIYHCVSSQEVKALEKRVRLGWKAPKTSQKEHRSEQLETDFSFWSADPYAKRLFKQFNTAERILKVS